MRWKAASRATEAIRTGSGISSPLARPGRPLPSQRSTRYANRPWVEAGRPSRSVSIWATSQKAVTWPLSALAARGMPRAICRARTGAGLPGSASARMIPAVISGRDPNRAGRACLVRASSSPKVSAATSASAVQPT